MAEDSLDLITYYGVGMVSASVITTGAYIADIIDTPQYFAVMLGIITPPLIALGAAMIYWGREEKNPPLEPSPENGLQEEELTDLVES